MDQYITYQKHIEFTSGKNIYDICSGGFKKTGITYFHFKRLFSDLSVIELSNNSQWLIHFYNKGYQNIDKLARHPKCYSDFHVLWDGWDTNCISYKTVGKDAEDNFNLGHGFSIVKSYKNHCDMYDFCADINNYQINNFYLYNIDLLEKFIFYFHEKANTLIDRAEKNRFIIKYDTDIDIYKEYPDTIPKYNITHKRFDLGSLTHKEQACLAWLRKGKTAEETGMILNISKRTVEKHLINLKRKLDCVTLFQLGYKSSSIITEKDNIFFNCDIKL